MAYNYRSTFWLSLPLSLLLLTLVTFSGCATLFDPSPAGVRVFGPTGIEVENNAGQSIRMYGDSESTYIYPEYGRDDTVVVSYHGLYQATALSRRPAVLTYLNLFNMGIGSVVDDLTHHWYGYNPLYVHVQKLAGRQDSLLVTSRNLLGEASGSSRPELLLVIGTGLSMSVHPVPAEEAGFLLGFTSISYDTRFEGGAGILGEDDVAYPLTAGMAGGLIGPTADISEISWQARYLFNKRLFVQGGFGYALTEVDSFDVNSNLIAKYASKVPMFEIGVGLAGDISTIALRYSWSGKPFNIEGYDPIYYRKLWLTFGLNLRL